jgi:hypothetical protein
LRSPNPARETSAACLQGQRVCFGTAAFGSVMVTFAYGAEILNLPGGPSTNFKARRRKIIMKRMMIPAIVFVALIGVAFALRARPASIELSAATAAMPSLLELHAMAGVNKLPMQETEDQSLVYPTVGKR